MVSLDKSTQMHLQADYKSLKNRLGLEGCTVFLSCCFYR